MHLNVAGFDPGKNNFGYSIVKVAFDEPFRYKVVTTGLIKEVVFDLTKGVRYQARPFKREVRALLKQYDVDVVMAERYQNRGRMLGNTLELVNFMLGVMESLPVQDYVLVTASQWKNAFNRHQDLKDFYTRVPLVPHRVDAALIALYGSYQYLNFQAKQFDFLCDEKSTTNLVNRIGNAHGG